MARLVPPFHDLLAAHKGENRQLTMSWHQRSHTRQVSVQEGGGVEGCVAVPAELTFSICFVRKAKERGRGTKSESKRRRWKSRGLQETEGVYAKCLFVRLLFFSNNSPTSTCAAHAVVTARSLLASPLLTTLSISRMSFCSEALTPAPTLGSHSFVLPLSVLQKNELIEWIVFYHFNSSIVFLPYSCYYFNCCFLAYSMCL